MKHAHTALSDAKADRVHCLQLMVRGFGPNAAEECPRRSAERQAADAAFRAVRAATAATFTYAPLRPGGPPASCEQFRAEDSSLTVLDLLGPLPEAGDGRDSDAVLVSRMHRYPGFPAAEVSV